MLFVMLQKCFNIRQQKILAHNNGDIRNLGGLLDWQPTPLLLVVDWFQLFLQQFTQFTSSLTRLSKFFMNTFIPSMCTSLHVVNGSALRV